MDRGVVHILEDDEEDKKPIISAAANLADHGGMDFRGASNSSTLTSFHPVQGSGSSMPQDMQPTSTFGQVIGLSMQEKQDGSSLQQSVNHVQPFIRPGLPSQLGDKGQNPNMIKKPGGQTSQAISFGALMPLLLPTLQPEQAQKLQALYTRLKKSEISKEDFLRSTRMLVGDQVLVNTVKQMQIKQMQGQMARQQLSSQADMPLQPSFSQHMQHMQQQQQQLQQQHAMVPPSAHQLGEPLSGHISGAQASTPSLTSTGPHAPSTPLPIPDGVTSLPGATTSSLVRTPPSKGVSDQKRPAEMSPTAMQGKSKKQKVAGDALEQSIDQLNDVTAVSGVNLREEEEQLLAGPKEESRSSQAMRGFAQEEEKRLFLELGPLHSKVMAIANKLGISSVNGEAERCLSMSVEERLRNMLYKLTKISSQRCDQEKEMHKVVVTSDIQKQIMVMRKKAKDALEKRQAQEQECLRKINEEKEKVAQAEGGPKDDAATSRAKEKKKAEEGKQKSAAAAAAAASMAARSANDMLLKWQMMAEQGRQRREGESGAIAPTTDVSMPVGVTTTAAAAAASGRKDMESKHGGLEVEVPAGRAATRDGGSTSGLKRTPGDAGPGRAFGHQPAKQPRTITAKDVLAYLETEPQMAKSPLIYRLYNKTMASSQAVS